MKQRILYLRGRSNLSGLAEACLSLTPRVSVYKDPGNAFQELFLEIAGTQKFFGGEDRLLAKAEDLYENFGETLQQVIVDRAEWARAFCVGEPSGFSRACLPEGQSERALLDLAIERLQFCGNPFEKDDREKEKAALVAFMRRVGMRTIADFVRLDVTAVTRRFGRLGAELLDWVRGKRDIVFPIFAPETAIQETLDTDDVTSMEGLLFYLREQLVRIEARLKGRRVVARKIRLTFHLECRGKLVKETELSQPLQDSSALLKILREFLQSLEWDAPLTRLELEIPDTQPATSAQLNLFDDSESRFYDLGVYVGRLRARLGDSAVGCAELRESYLPEKSWGHVWPPPALPPPDLRFAGRPLFLFAPPKPIVPSRNWLWKPSENLACEWWEGEASRRYFVVQTTQKEKLWVFFDSQKQSWFVHGVFD